MGKRKIEIIDSCKCCLEEIGLKNMWTDYCSEGEREIYGEMLTECFSLPWERPSESEIEYICETCISRLRDALSFKKEILYTDHLLKGRQKNVGSENIKQEEDSDPEIETEYLSIEYLDEEDVEKEKSDIKIEISNTKKDTDDLILNSNTKKYTEDDLEKCLEAVRSNTLSQSKASILYNVPRKIISAAIARPRNASSKVIRTKRHEKRTNADREMAKNIHNKMFPEFENFGKDVSTLFDCSNATPIRCRGGVGYKCCFCPDEFPVAADLKKHTIEQHDSKTKRGLIKGKYLSTILVKLDITSLHCTLCNTDMNNLEQLIDHLITVHGKNIHRNIKNYILPFKFHGEELRCIMCHSLFNKFKVLQEHMNTHFRNYVCDECEAGFVTRTILLNHIRRHQMGSFKCDYCPKIYDTLRRKKSHEHFVHVHKNMLNKCGYCNEKFDSYLKKEYHLVKAHGVSSVTFNCQACEKTFMTQRSLRDHTKRDHLMEKHYTCSECDMKFYRPCELSRHMVKHTGIKNYKCEVCLKSFLRSNTLREHLRIHANDRRFKCEHCGQAFVQKCSWRGHMRSKHGEDV